MSPIQARSGFPFNASRVERGAAKAGIDGSEAIDPVHQNQIGLRTAAGCEHAGHNAKEVVIPSPFASSDDWIVVLEKSPDARESSKILDLHRCELGRLRRASPGRIRDRSPALGRKLWSLGHRLSVDEQLQVVCPGRDAGADEKRAKDKAVSFGIKRQSYSEFLPVVGASELLSLHFVGGARVPESPSSRSQRPAKPETSWVRRKAAQLNTSTGEIPGMELSIWLNSPDGFRERSKRAAQWPECTVVVSATTVSAGPPDQPIGRLPEPRISKPGILGDVLPRVLRGVRLRLRLQERRHRQDEP